MNSVGKLGRIDAPDHNGKPVMRETDPLISIKDKSQRHVPFEYRWVWWENLQRSFGYKILVLLFTTQHLLKGFTSAYVGKLSPYLFKSYHLSAPRVQLYGGVIVLPWDLKPIFGLISDVFPIGGFKKAPYMLLTTLISAPACLAIACSGSLYGLGIEQLVLCLLAIQLQVAMCDLLTEAKYTEKIRDNPEHGDSLISYVWFGMPVAGIIAALAATQLIDHFGAALSFLPLIIPLTAVAVPLSRGYMEETTCDSDKAVEIRRQYREQPELLALIALTFFSSVIFGSLGLFSHDPLMNSFVGLAFGLMMLGAFAVVLSPVIAKIQAFTLINNMLQFRTSGASFYFYTDTPEQYPDGPHFSTFFYVTVLGVVGSVCSIAGIIFYNMYLSKLKYRNLMVSAALVSALLSLLDVMMFARLNVKYGIPDQFCIFGLTIFETVIGTWWWMPTVMMASHLCPKGMEATMFALLAGCNNIGNTINGQFGALLLTKLGVQPTGQVGDEENFKNLWIAATVSTMLPFVSVLVMYRLIPDAKQGERLVNDENYDATSGSLWNRWFGHSTNGGLSEELSI